MAVHATFTDMYAHPSIARTGNKWYLLRLNNKTVKIMKITKTKDEIIVEGTEPSAKAMAVRNAIIDACIEQNVYPKEIYPVFGEAIVSLLRISAQILDYDEESYVHNFGEGLATCKLKKQEDEL